MNYINTKRIINKIYLDTITNTIIVFILLALGICEFAYAQFDPKDPRKSPELTVCSQNLKNFGSYEDLKARSGEITQSEYDQKINGLTKRFAVAGCDVIAVQEILGKGEVIALSALTILAKSLTQETGRPFVAKVSSVGDGVIRNGFLIALDRSEIINVISYAKIELPKLLETQKSKIFERAPVELQLQVKGREGSDSKVVTLLNFHLKSRAGSAEDPTGLQYETVRMEMAESIRRLIDLRHRDDFTDPSKILVVLGDRNTDFQLAAAKILEGTLSLSDFRSDGPCRLSKHGVPICKTEQRRPQKLFSPLTLDPETRGVAGTYYYKDEASWIDDILMPQVSLKYAQASVFDEGNYDSGTVSKPRAVSDHSLVFVRLNW